MEIDGLLAMLPRRFCLRSGPASARADAEPRSRFPLLWDSGRPHEIVF